LNAALLNAGGVFFGLAYALRLLLIRHGDVCNQRMKMEIACWFIERGAAGSIVQSVVHIIDPARFAPASCGTHYFYITSSSNFVSPDQ
jgi:hypothetical protein